MALVKHFRGLLLLTTTFFFTSVLSQSDSAGDTIFSSLDGLGCTIFKKIIQDGGLQNQFSRRGLPMTLFVFNDTAYNQLPAGRRNSLYITDNKNRNGAEEYVNSFTLRDNKDTASFQANIPYPTNSWKLRTLFLDRKRLTFENTASGSPGATKYFCNGAIVLRNNIRAGSHLIHILDRVLDMQWPSTALAFASGENPTSLEYEFYLKLMKFLKESAEVDPEMNYQEQVMGPTHSAQTGVTFFLPTNEALGRIPREQLSKLQGDPARLLKILTLHIIPNKVLFTSLVNHNEGFTTQANSGNIIFRKNYNRDAVYVTGSLTGGRPVTARISPANTAVLNGVVHQIDSILGFVYLSAIEEIENDPNTGNFEQLVAVVRPSLKAELSQSSGVIMFVPTNNALIAINNVYENYINNQSLINMVFEFHMLQRNEPLQLTKLNVAYESAVTAISRFNRRRIKVYSEGNDTWVEGGYVRARVIKPDIGVTNGVIHQIDAVFGIPTRDIPYSIYCESWLWQSYVQMKFTGLDEYMRDPMLKKNQQCVFRAGGRDNTLTSGGAVSSFGGGNSGNNANQQNSKYSYLCGGGLHRCEFTFFVPNGTAIEAFSRTPHGRTIMNEQRRWRWLLRRLTSFQEKIYIDQIAPGSMRSFVADNGETVFIRVNSQGSFSSGRTSAYVMFQNARADIIHSDIGATNGVYHIISQVLYVSEDTYRDVSSASVSTASLTCLLASLWSILSQTTFIVM